MSPLAQALRFGGLQDVLSILRRGVDPNAAGDFHLSAEDFESKLDALMAHGWEIDRCQLLHDAKHGLGQRVIAYLDRGADPNTVDANGQTALHKFAVAGIGKAAIEALVAAGAAIDAKDAEGNTPLDLARYAKRQSAYRALCALTESRP